MEVIVHVIHLIKIIVNVLIITSQKMGAILLHVKLELLMDTKVQIASLKLAIAQMHSANGTLLKE